MKLAAYALSEAVSKGRAYQEETPLHRNQFQRDRDRIVHCSAFRRLEYKTQVFMNHEGDMFRTRLTHSIEVAQIGRTIARVLCLNEDLTEAICLAHDLGHTPFGHTGQATLNACMKAYGGFEHNLQSLRIVDSLEEKYAEFRGLNLMYETREGILKHCPKAKAKALGEIGQRFLRGMQPSLEAQVANFADEIAYNSHDIDDGLRSGLISIDQLGDCELFRLQQEKVLKKWPKLVLRRRIHETIRRIINCLVDDLIMMSRQNIQAVAPSDVGAVREAGKPLISFSKNIAECNLQLKRFLYKNLYQHSRVRLMNAQAEQIIRMLFTSFISDTEFLPVAVQQNIADCTSEQRHRVIADYIAGMTDRFAISECQRLGHIKLPID